MKIDTQQSTDNIRMAYMEYIWILLNVNNDVTESDPQSTWNAETKQ